MLIKSTRVKKNFSRNWVRTYHPLGNSEKILDSEIIVEHEENGEIEGKEKMN